MRCGRSLVVGVPHHLDDHSLQQFVGYLTNRTVRFGYEAFTFEGKQVGVIKIDRQPRPVYLKRDFGKLQREKVYVRRASSIDPARPASPDEIASMGLPVESESHVPELLVEFAEVERDRSLGTSIHMETQLWQLPSFEEIPDLEDRRSSGPLGIDLPALGMHRPNRDYYREYAAYMFTRDLFRPVRLVVTNTGSVAAVDVHVVLQASMKSHTAFIDSGDVPERPEAETVGPDMSMLRNIRRVSREPGDVEVTKDNEESRVEIACGLLQPGRKVWSESFHVGIAADGDVEVVGSLFARNLPKPERFALTIQAKTERRTLSLRRLRTLADNTQRGDESVAAE